MKLRVIILGKPKLPFVSVAMDHFMGRIRKYVEIGIDILPGEPITAHATRDKILEIETDRIIKTFRPYEKRILLDVDGLKMDSDAFSKRLENFTLHGAKSIVFIIGSPYGVSDRLRKEVDLRMSLSAMTFSHETTLPILLEQIYRAYAIMHNEPFVKY